MKHPLGVLLALTLLAGTTVAQPPAEKPIATVNGDKLTAETFVKVLMSRYGARTLNALISNMVIRQAAKAAGVTIGQQELEDRMKSTQRAIDVRAPLTGDTFERWLAKQGLTVEYFTAEMYDQMLLERMVQSKLKVTPEMVASFYQRNKDQLTEPAQVRVAHICVQDEAQAKAIRQEIVDKKITWDEAVKKYGLDPWTRDSGGDMGFITLADTDFHRAAFSLKQDGDIAPVPIMTSMGYHVIKRLEYKNPYIPRFEEIEKTIQQELERTQLRYLSTAKREEIIKAAKLDVKLEIPHEPFPVMAPTPAAAPAPAPAPAH